MNSSQFTGTCMIALGSESAVLVLNEGLVVLAEYGGIKGQHVLDTLLEGGESEVAAELNSLTPEQIQLSLEFNRPCAIAEPDAGRQKKSMSGKAAPRGTKRTGAASSSKHRPEPPAEMHHIPMPGVKSLQETTAVPPSASNDAAPPSTSDEMETLVQNMEDLDVDQLVGSFKVNCKEMLRRIHLDHLIQDKDT
ncbi:MULTISPECIES: hypothetical protein [unclassified Methanoculleus]|jgi:hypothetical protein|uniref:Uncharacterized protein n=2 Tax=Methanoculleus TaxID=45989 RepID=A0ABD8A858_9EURY|nr:hypothetical protein [Methanoculleus sp. UBA377]WOX55716.1 hypothetical protein R6Y95_09625 [Methanoculleus palmolei]